MYGLPLSTERKQQLPKKAIYAKFEWKPAQREHFDADIARIGIVAVVSPDTVPGLGEGVVVKEFYLLAVQLKRREYDIQNIAQLTKLIPQNMVFALQYDNRTQFAVPLSGLNLDAVWEHIVKGIGQIEVAEGHTLTEQIAVDDQRAKLLAQIATLERKMANEKQPRRKREYFELIKNLKEQI